MFYCETGSPSNIMTTGLLKDIAKYTTLEVMSAVPVRKQQKTPVTSDQNIKVVRYEPRHGKMCLRGKFGHFEIL